MRIAIAKGEFKRKVSLLTRKLNIELNKKLVRYYVWIITLYGSESWTLRELKRNYLESFKMWCFRRIQKIKWSEKITIEQVLEVLGEKRTLRNNVLHRKVI